MVEVRSVLCAIALAVPVGVFTQAPPDSVSPRPKQLHDRAIVVDSHADTTQRLIFDEAFDIGNGTRTATSTFRACAREAWTRCSSRSGCRAMPPVRRP